MNTIVKLDNKDKLLLAAIELMSEKGYNGVSTKEIALAAGVSEMTLFRKFGSKLNLLEAAVERFHYAGEMKRIFDEKLVWDLRADLSLISRTYHETMNRNRKLILLVMKDADLCGLGAKTQEQPRRLLELLTAYFTKMREMGKLIETDAEAQAIAFMWMNYGAFISRLYGAETITSVTLDGFMDSSIELFVRGLTP